MGVGRQGMGSGWVWVSVKFITLFPLTHHRIYRRLAMPLQGQAKKDYQREYMLKWQRAKRGSKQGSKQIETGSKQVIPEKAVPIIPPVPQETRIPEFVHCHQNRPAKTQSTNPMMVGYIPPLI